MSRAFILPDLGEGLTEAAVVAWLVAPGDEVAIDQPVVELESAKSVVQLPTPFAGVVESLGGEVGDVLHAGTVLMTLADGEAGSGPDAAGDAAAAGSVATGGAVAADAAASPIPDAAPESGALPSAETVPAAASAATDAAPAAPPAAAHGDADASGAVLIGYGTRQVAASKRDAGAPARFGRARSGSPAGSPPRLQAGRRSPVVSPIVRRIARDHGFDASELLGSGPDGLVARSDVEAFIREQEGAAASAPVDARVEPAAPVAAPVRSPSAGEHRVSLSSTARAAAAHFTRSRQEIPEATVWMDVDATELLAARRQLQEATGERFGVTALVARFVVAGLARHPSLNATFDAERDELVLHDAVNLGLAAQTPRGLLVPVVHSAERMSLRELRDAVARRTEQAASGAFPPDALAGGTFTFNNYGTLGVDGSAAIINHPEAAMLGIGRLVERPWVVDGALAVRTVTELTLSFDHRVCDGAEAAAFLTFVAHCIERPISLLADL
jgi:pyruvate dehydrogenase E2 component (dihydrolipoamide acetyltransferase)